MLNGLCIFCDDWDIFGYYNLKYKGVKIFVIESDEVMVIKNNDEFIFEESLVEFDEFVIKIMMKLDFFYELLESFILDL